MKKKELLKVFLFVTSPIWIAPFLLFELAKIGWEETSVFVERRFPNV